MKNKIVKGLEPLDLSIFAQNELETSEKVKGGSVGNGAPTTQHDATWSAGNTPTPTDDHYVCDHSSDKTWW